MDIKKDIVLRMGIVYVLIVIFAIIIIAKIIHLQFIEGDSLRAQARKPKQNIVEAKRGDILDRNGKILTTSVPFYHIYFDPRIDYFKKNGKVFTDSVKALAAGLSGIFNDGSQLATTKYYNKLISAYSNQKLLLIKRKISYPQLKKVKALPVFNKGSYKGGLIINPEHIRVKPYKDLAYRTLGYLQENAKKNIVGRVGLERAFETELCGENGFKFYGNSPDVDDNNMRIIPKDGYNVVSSIDIDIQDIAHDILKKFIVEIEARYGCVVVMEVATGDVLAIANIGKNAHGDYTETFNYAVGTKAEPGSTFKIMSMMAALEDGVVTPSTLIKTGDGSIKIYDKTIHDIIKDKGDNGTITAREVIKFSSNVGIVKIITENYDKRRSDFINRLYNMGLNQKLGIPIDGEASPVIKYPTDKSWSGLTLAQMAYGYEVELTPLQILTFYNAIANNGVMVKPRFALEIRDRSKTIKTFDVEVLNPAICQEKTIKQAQDMLESVTEPRGTAVSIHSPYYKIAGKTGTAQIAINNRAYSLDGVRYHRGSFCGYFPADKPKYSCIVVVDSSANSSVVSGARVAGVFKKIADKIFANDIDLQREYMPLELASKKTTPFARDGFRTDLQSIIESLGLEYVLSSSTSEWVITSVEDQKLVLNNRTIKELVVPNVKGMGLRDAIYLLEKQGLQVDVKGYGIVKQQSLVPGQTIKNGDRILIELG